MPPGILGPILPIGGCAPVGFLAPAAQKYTATMIANTMMMTITATAGLTCFPPVANCFTSFLLIL
ncbi:hypothetical protein H5T88_04820 [bacterium]|nr:hypothetical protein [bacterium]